MSVTRAKKLRWRELVERDKRIRELWTAGLSSKSIGALLGLNASTVRGRASTLKLPKRNTTKARSQVISRGLLRKPVPMRLARLWIAERRRYLDEGVPLSDLKIPQFALWAGLTGRTERVGMLGDKFPHARVALVDEGDARTKARRDLLAQLRTGIDHDAVDFDKVAATSGLTRQYVARVYRWMRMESMTTTKRREPK